MEKPHDREGSPETALLPLRIRQRRRLGFLLMAGGGLFLFPSIAAMVLAQVWPEFRLLLKGLGDSLVPAIVLGLILLVFGWCVRPVIIR